MHYLHDDKNNRIEGLSKEEIYALLAAAIQQGQLPSVDEDTAFVTMFKSIVDGKTYKMAFCTQAQYNQLEAQGLLVADAYYIITDDTAYDDIETLLNSLNNDINDEQNGLKVRVATNEIEITNIKNDYVKKIVQNSSMGIEVHQEPLMFEIRTINSTGIGNRYKFTISLFGIIVYKYDAAGTTLVESFELTTKLEQVNKVTPQTIQADSNNNYEITKSGLYKVTVQDPSNSKYRNTLMLSIDNIDWLKETSGGSIVGNHYEAYLRGSNNYVFADYTLKTTTELATYIRSNTLTIINCVLLIEY